MQPEELQTGNDDVDNVANDTNNDADDAAA